MAIKPQSFFLLNLSANVDLPRVQKIVNTHSKLCIAKPMSHKLIAHSTQALKILCSANLVVS